MKHLLFASLAGLFLLPTLSLAQDPDNDHYITGTLCEKAPVPVAGEPTPQTKCDLLTVNVGSITDCTEVADAWSTTLHFTKMMQQIPRYRGGSARLKCLYSPILIEIPDGPPTP